MAKLPSLKRLFQRDILGSPEWFNPVLIVLNSFFQNLWQALNHGLTLQDNIQSQIVVLQYVGGSVVNLTTNLNVPLIGVIPLQVSGGTVTGGVSVIWRQIEQTIEITQITGLTVGEQFNIRLLFI